MNAKLKVLPVSTAMVPHYEAQEAGIVRFVGRVFKPGVEPSFEKGAIKHPGVASQFVPVEGPVELPFRAEYVQHLKAGDLQPADAETAALCGLRFNAKG